MNDERLEELISREDLIDAFNDPKNGGKYGDFDDGSVWSMTENEIFKVIRMVRPAQPKTGHWIHHGGWDGRAEYYECSECGLLQHFCGTPEDNHAYYCQNCGSKNGGEKNER